MTPPIESLVSAAQLKSQANPCRFCGEALRHTFVDLGMSPLCESYLTASQLNSMEPFYPLHVLVCSRCFLVQLQQYVSAESIFSEYAYFSSFSDSWLAHAKAYTEKMVSRFSLDSNSSVIELASNDGYLLQYFAEKKIPVLGIEPAANVAKVAESKGVRTLVKFFGRATANELCTTEQQADLLLGNNVLAQVPDLNDFVAGMKIILKPSGILTLEFPHLLRLMKENQFDTIYHEHFSYFSLFTADKVLRQHGLKLFDVEELETHGGSLRVYACHAESNRFAASPSVARLLAMEKKAGLTQIKTYSSFAEQVKDTKRKLLNCLIKARTAGKRVVAYGAPGKGNTLLNYCGIRSDFVEFTVDRNPYKQGRFLPGTHIPIFPPEHLAKAKPDYVLILPWNLRKEIQAQLSFISDWGGAFLIPIPELRIVRPQRKVRKPNSQRRSRPGGKRR